MVYSVKSFNKNTIDIFDYLIDLDKELLLQNLNKISFSNTTQDFKIFI